MFCQSCGASNADEARFCNMCGSRIARAGEPGGPVAEAPSEASPAAAAPLENSPRAYAKTEQAPEVSPATLNEPAARVGNGQGSAPLQGAPSPYSAGGAGGGPSMMDVSLASIGVRSNKKGFAVVAVVALVLLGLGAGASYLLTGGEVAPGPAGSAEADDPFVIGTPLPEGANTPEVDIVSGGDSHPGTPSMEARPSGGGNPGRRPSRAGSAHTHGGTGMATTMTSTMTAAMTPAVATNMTATMSPGTMSTVTSGSSGRTGTMTPRSTATGGGQAAAGGTTTGGGQAAGGGTTTGGGTTDMSGASGGMTTAGGGAIPDDAPAESDIAMDMYGARVRFVVRRYYAARARNCFDRATRNNPNVSGTVIINMTIAASGQVGRTSVTRNTTGDATLGACLAGQVGQWRLPPPPGGSLEMQMPFSR